jgi:hypothetical protein
MDPRFREDDKAGAACRLICHSHENGNPRLLKNSVRRSLFTLRF